MGRQTVVVTKRLSHGGHDTVSGCAKVDFGTWDIKQFSTHSGWQSVQRSEAEWHVCMLRAS